MPRSARPAGYNCLERGRRRGAEWQTARVCRRETSRVCNLGARKREGFSARAYRRWLPVFRDYRQHCQRVRTGEGGGVQVSSLQMRPVNIGLTTALGLRPGTHSDITIARGWLEVGLADRWSGRGIHKSLTFISTIRWCPLALEMPSGSG